MRIIRVDKTPLMVYKRYFNPLYGLFMSHFETLKLLCLFTSVWLLVITIRSVWFITLQVIDRIKLGLNWKVNTSPLKLVLLAALWSATIYLFTLPA